MTNNGRLLLLDGYAHIYRSFYAIRELTNPRGEPVNALFAMARLLMKLDQEYPHEFAALVMDKGKPVKRIEILPEYKATRVPMPDPLRAQVPLIREWAEACGWVIVEEEGREADDLIAALAKAREGRETFIFSHDKDLAQLVEPGVSLVLPGGKGKPNVLDEAGVIEKFGVPPGAICDYLAMIGDNVDNIPGIPGVGPKTAVKLLQQFGSVDAMLLALDQIERQSIRDKVRDAADVLHRNQTLVALDTAPPAGWQGMASVRRTEPQWDVLIGTARDHGFKSVVTSLQKAKQDAMNPMLF